MAKQKTPRLTDQLNVVLAKASSAVSLGKAAPASTAAGQQAVKCCEVADAALHEAAELLIAIRRAAESI